MPFFPGKIRVFLGLKRGKNGNRMIKNICRTSFLIVLGSGNLNFGARILSVQNLMSIIQFIM